MCNACVAGAILAANEKGQHYTINGQTNCSWGFNPGIDIQVRNCAGPEFAPGELRFRREGETDWSPWAPFYDLASASDVLGGDWDIASLHPDVHAWLMGGPAEPVVKLFEARNAK